VRFYLCFAALLLVALLLGPGPASAQEAAERCRDAATRDQVFALKLALELCDEALSSGNLSTEQRAAVLSERARVNLKLGEPAAAMRDLAAAETADPTYLPIYLLRGEHYLDMGAPGLALESFERAVELEPDNGALRLRRADLYLSLGRDAEALSDFKLLAAQQPKNPIAHANLGRAYIRFAQYEEALASLARAIELEPSQATFHIDRARAHTLLGDYPSALADLDLAIEVNGTNARAYFWRGWVHFEAGQDNEAIADLDKALDLHPTLASALALKGHALLRSGKPEQGLTAIERARTAAPEDVIVLNVMGLVMLGAEDFTQAEAFFFRAVSVEPQFADAHLHHAIALLEQHFRKPVPEIYRRALADLDEAVRLKPRYPTAFATRAMVRYMAGDRDGAEADFAEALTQNDEAAGVFVLRGTMHYAEGDLASSLADLDHALSLEPDNLGALMSRSWVLLGRGERAAALEDFILASEMPGATSDTWTNMGLGLFAVGDFDGAAESFAKALETGPPDAYLPIWHYLALARAESGADAIGDLSEAREWLMGDLWPRAIYDLFIERADPAGLIDKAWITGDQETRELKVQAHFFLAQFHLLTGDRTAAHQHFEAVLAADIGHLHHTTLARFELERMEDKQP
jgi:tetratricopeptide (TPR) repeat protein